MWTKAFALKKPSAKAKKIDLSPGNSSSCGAKASLYFNSTASVREGPAGFSDKICVQIMTLTSALRRGEPLGKCGRPSLGGLGASLRGWKGYQKRRLREERVEGMPMKRECVCLEVNQPPGWGVWV